MKLETVELDVKDGRGPVCVAASPEDAVRLSEFFAWAMKADEERDARNEEIYGVIRYCRDVQAEGTANERVVAQNVARILSCPPKQGA